MFNPAQEGEQGTASRGKTTDAMPKKPKGKTLAKLRRWTPKEDEMLRAGVGHFGPKNWKEISSDFMHDTRTAVQCLHRWQKVLKPGLVKGPWTPPEDQIVRNCIKNGYTKWARIAECVGGRIGKQCRERWFNHLSPAINKGRWTVREDAILLKAHTDLGNWWVEISKRLPGRTENAVKNRWNSKLRSTHYKNQREKTLHKRLQQQKQKTLSVGKAQVPHVANSSSGSGSGGASVASSPAASQKKRARGLSSGSAGAGAPDNERSVRQRTE